METNTEVINDLKGLVKVVKDGKEGYESAAETTDRIELKAVFLKYAAQRTGYALELNRHIAAHGGKSENEARGTAEALPPSWNELKQALHDKQDAAILGAIETAEKSALEKYDQVLEHYAAHLDHIVLLQRQKTGILEALNEIEANHHRLANE